MPYPLLNRCGKNTDGDTRHILCRPLGTTFAVQYYSHTGTGSMLDDTRKRLGVINVNLVEFFRRLADGDDKLTCRLCDAGSCEVRRCLSNVLCCFSCFREDTSKHVCAIAADICDSFT